MLKEGLHDGNKWKPEAHNRYAELESSGTVSPDRSAVESEHSPSRSAADKSVEYSPSSTKSQPSPSGDYEKEAEQFWETWGWDGWRNDNRDIKFVADWLRAHDAKVGQAEQGLREALQNVVESSINDADCCTICGNDVTKHSLGCAIERAKAALKEPR